MANPRQKHDLLPETARRLLDIVRQSSTATFDVEPVEGAQKVKLGAAGPRCMGPHADEKQTRRMLPGKADAGSDGAPASHGPPR